MTVGETLSETHFFKREVTKFAAASLSIGRIRKYEKQDKDRLVTGIKENQQE